MKLNYCSGYGNTGNRKSRDFKKKLHQHLNTLNDITIDNADRKFETGKFEKLYLASRKIENRVYTDQQLNLLPSIESTHIHFKEWRTRKRSSLRLLNYLKKKKRALSILEMGCGNGWLSAMLADLERTTVTGMDINQIELNQAKRVFASKPNLEFVDGSINSIDRRQKMDIIIFAASIQYFPSFDDTIIRALSHLKEDGEIHILDSHLYKPAELINAVERTRFYYQSMGYPGMAEYYFHHSIASLQGFRYRVLFQPGSLKNKFIGNKDPFPWICISAK